MFIVTNEPPITNRTSIPLVISNTMFEYLLQHPYYNDLGNTIEERKEILLDVLTASKIYVSEAVFKNK